jgi:hypothetical protein
MDMFWQPNGGVVLRKDPGAGMPTHTSLGLFNGPAWSSFDEGYRVFVIFSLHADTNTSKVYLHACQALQLKGQRAAMHF